MCKYSPYIYTLFIAQHTVFGIILLFKRRPFILNPPTADKDLILTNNKKKKEGTEEMKKQNAVLLNTHIYLKNLAG